MNRRIKERRSIEYQFGSTAWLGRVRQGYQLWPKLDRRKTDRRSQDRRRINRRAQNIKMKHAKNQLTPQNLLTAEEKQMLNDLMREDTP